MNVIVVIFAAILLAPMPGNASVAEAPAVASVLHAVARDYCVKGKPTDSLLDSKVARINDIDSSRQELLSFFGDVGVVNRYFLVNSESAVLPAHLNYSCFRLSKGGVWALSIPVFSKSGDTAYVYVAYNCQALYGHGEMNVLHRVSGRWKVTEVKRMWVS